MPPIYLRGTLSPVLQTQTVESDPQRGYVVRSVYTGTDEGVMGALANQLIYQGIQASLTQENGFYKLVANDATQNNPVDVWEIEPNALHVDALQHPNVIGLISDDQMAALRTALENTISAKKLFASGQPLASIDPLVQRTYANYLAGEEEFENDAYGGGYVLKHTLNVPNRWQGGSDFLVNANIGCIYSPAILIPEATSDNWIFPVTGRLLVKLNAIGGRVPPIRDNYLWGWKKGRALEQTCANNRLEITQNYIIEQWNTDQYEIAIPVA